MLKNSQDCACRAIDNHWAATPRKRRPFVVLTSEDDYAEVQKVVSVSMPDGSECLGSVWRTPDGELVTVRKYMDPLPTYEDGFELSVCNGGRVYSTPETKNIKRWRNAARS